MPRKPGIERKTHRPSLGTGEVLSDFIKLARTTLDESGDDAKNVAAVLAAAAFEDVVRRLADIKGLGHQEEW